jgi:hypothetical protein
VSHFSLQIESSGPFLHALVGVSQPRAAALTNAGLTVPPAVQIRGLIDTGASSTCIDPSVLFSLDLTRIGTVRVSTPTTGSTPHDVDQFDVGLVVPATTGAPPLVVPAMPVVCAELLAAQGFHALIGRDLLGQCVFVYNGSTKIFTLAF